MGLDKNYFYIKFKETNGGLMKEPDTEHFRLSDLPDEFRRITENSREQSKAINAVLKNIRESVSEIKKYSEEVLEKFDKIDSRPAAASRLKMGQEVDAALYSEYWG